MAELILRGAVFTGDDFIQAGSVVVDQSSGIIVGVGRKGEVNEPRGARTIEIASSTILPGLIDAHVHFFGSKTHDLMEWVTTPETLVALRSVADLRRLVSAGFTAVRDLGSKAGTYLKRAVDEGIIDGPRIVAAGRSLSQTGGDDDPTILPLDMAERLSYSYYCDGPWECRRAVRKVERDGGDVIKVYASGSFAQGNRVRRQFTVEELKAIVEEAHTAGMRVASHAYGEDALANSIEAGVDSIEHGIGLTPELAKQIHDKGIYYVPTLSTYTATKPTTNQARKKLTKRHLTEDMKIAKEFKLKIVAGTDYIGCDTGPHGENYHEIVNLAKHIGNKEALIAATSRAAQCLGLEKTGSIKQGYIADIIIVKGNPIERPENLSPNHIIHVMQKGRMQIINGKSNSTV